MLATAVHRVLRATVAHGALITFVFLLRSWGLLAGGDSMLSSPVLNVYCRSGATAVGDPSRCRVMKDRVLSMLGSQVSAAVFCYGPSTLGCKIPSRFRLLERIS